MSSVKMVALMRHPFGTGEREAGEEYHATAEEANVLESLGWGKRKKHPEPEQNPVSQSDPTTVDEPDAVSRKDMTAEASDKPAKGANYKRRDLSA